MLKHKIFRVTVMLEEVEVTGDPENPQMSRVGEPCVETAEIEPTTGDAFTAKVQAEVERVARVAGRGVGRKMALRT